MAGDRQLLHKMLSPIGHSQKVPNLLMELQFLVTNEALMEPESGLNFSAMSTLEGFIRCRCITPMHFGRITKRCAAERRANSNAPMIRQACTEPQRRVTTRC
jgi:hypothetical protein